MLTQTQKNNIEALRIMNHSYKQIGVLLGISEEVIRKHCTRNSLNPDENYDRFILNRCQNCGKYIVQKTDRKKKYCSSYCRRKKWRESKKMNSSLNN